MEEYRSIEFLAKEIERTAQKKAQGILLSAEDTGKKELASVAERVNAARLVMAQGVKDRVAAFKKNSAASLPLEKERFRTSFVQSALSRAFASFAERLTESDLLSFVVASYKKAKTALGNLPMTAVCVGMDAKTALAALQKAGAKVIEPVEGSASAATPDPLDAGVMLQSSRTKTTITLRKILSEIEDEKRLELTIALFGEKWGEICQA